DLGRGDGGGHVLRRGEDRAALELDAHVQAAHPEAEDGRDGDQDGDAVPDPAVLDEVVAGLAVVQAGAEVAQLGHLRPPSIRRRHGGGGGAAGAGPAAVGGGGGPP